MQGLFRHKISSLIRRENIVVLILLPLFLAFLSYNSLLNSKEILYSLIVFDPYFFPAYALTAILICLFFIYSLLTKFLYRFTIIDLSLITYSVYIAFNYILRDFSYNENLTNQLLPIFFVFLIKQLFYHKTYGSPLKVLCFVAILLFGFYEALHGELQLLRYRPSHNRLFSLTGAFYYPGPYAILLSPVFLISLSIVLFPLTESALARWVNTLGFITLCAISVLIPATQSRSSWVGTFFSAVLLLSVNYKKELSITYNKVRPGYKVICYIIVLTLLVAGAYLLYRYKPESTTGRILVWRVSWEAFQHNPLFGIGFDRFRTNFGNFLSEFMAAHMRDTSLVARADFIPYAFNDFLQILVENGFVGFLIFVLIIYFCFQKGFERINTKSTFLLGSISALISLLLAACFSYPFEMGSIWFLFLFFIIVISYESGDERVTFFSNSFSGRCLAFLGILLMIFVLNKQIYMVRAKGDWDKARFLFADHAYEEAIKQYRVALRELPNQPEILLGYGKALYITGKFQESAHILEKALPLTSDPFLYINLGNAYLKLKKYDLAERSYRKAILILPNRMYPRYLLARMYCEVGNTLEARKMAAYIVHMPVPVSSPASRQISSEMRQLLIEEK